MSKTLLAQGIEVVEARIEELDIGPKTVMTILKYAMESVEKLPVKGSEQRELAIRIVKHMIEKADIEEGVKEVCKTIVSSGALDATIDVIVDASRGRLQINQVVEVATDVAESCCLPLLQGKKRS